MARSSLMYLVALPLVFACADGSETPPEVDGDAHTGTHGSVHNESSSSSQASDIDVTSMMIYTDVEAYLEAYCSALSVRCGLYSGVDDCVDDIMTTWFSGECWIHSQRSANECIAWLEELDCEESGWLDACDEALICE